MEIALVAGRLFVTHGLRATRAEDIAQAAGVAPRTFYRYFATKEEAIGPLFGAGTERWAKAVREAPAALSVPQALEHGARQVLTPGAGVSLGALDRARTLLRLAEESPGLLRVWAERCLTSERALAQALASRGLGPAGSPETRFTAAVASAAVRVAFESWSAGDAPADGPTGPAALAVRNLGTLRDFPWSGASS
ncbi:TetR/AcrR family transcriptional regulator [Streptomyces sp. SID12501]|uniref:TetR family transcriptional regulator n=1 Tax=Streptomyces sp. SID12501 TaxID=2706042 RepID=A0A6B3BPU9_9ACTN|nr:TetR family transcriptional regulator [Streptomyces sp. SID12501]NEC86360.1 TetR family transcriptional regulator [Streptomyces sp. SID12501]